MRVKELMETLANMPMDAEVYVTDDSVSELICDRGAGLREVELDESLNPVFPDVVLKFEAKYLKFAIEQDHLDNEECRW